MTFNYYEIINKVNGKKYIGITEKLLEERIGRHYALLRKGIHYNSNLQKDWNIYQEENFEYKLISSEEYPTIELGYEHEYELISNESNLYNMAPGGLVNPMYSDEIREKMIKTKQSKVPDILQLEEIEENVFKVINRFKSQKEAQRVTGLSQANINKSIKNRVKGSGYYWIEETLLKDFEKVWKPVRTKITPTAQLNEKGEIIKVHHNRSLFEKEYGWSLGSIKGAIQRNGRTRGIKFINITEEEYYKIKPITLLF